MSGKTSSTARDPKRYERIKLGYGLANLVIYFLVPLAVLFSGLSVSIRDWISDWTGGYAIPGAIAYIVIGSVVLELVTLPLGYFSGHVLEKRYELTRRSVGGWALDWLKGLGLQTVLLAVFVALLYLLLMRGP